MKPGHPFETDELDHLRARQRRYLRAIPQWFMEMRTATPAAIQVEPADRLLVEGTLRRAATALVDGEMLHSLEHWLLAETATPTLAALNASMVSRSEMLRSTTDRLNKNEAQRV